MTIRLSSRSGGGKPPLGRLVTTNTTITTADLGGIVAVDTLAGVITLTMPSAPTIGDAYYFLDARGNWGVNAVILSSALYYTTTQTFSLDVAGGLIIATWRGAPTGWTIGSDNPSLDNTQLNTLMSLLAPLTSPALAGVPTTPTAAAGTSTTQIASTAFVTAAVAAGGGGGGSVSLNNTALTGIPTAPTAAAGTNTTQIASTAFVTAAVAAVPAGSSAPVISRTVSAATDVMTVADKSKAIAVDTTTNAVTLTLPTTGLTVGDQYTFIDIKMNWGVRAAILASATFFSTVQTVALDTPGDQVTATWRGLPVGWTMGSGSATMDNTSLNTLFGLKAPLASPALTGVPTAPTATAGTNNTQLANTAFVAAAVAAGGGGGSAAVSISRTTSAATDTVLASDLGKAVAVDTTTNAVVLTLPSTGQVVGDKYSFLDAKANWAVRPASLASATFYGTAQTVSLDTAGGMATATWRGLPIGWTLGSDAVAVDNTTLNTLFGLKASVDSPTFTGVPAVPTATVGTNTTQIANTAFVTAAVAAGGGGGGGTASITVSRTVSTATDTVLSTDKGKAIAVDTTVNAVVLTLPTTGQVMGDTYSFLDSMANWGIRAASLASATFYGTVQTAALDSTGDLVTVTWRGLPIGWTVGSGSATFDSITLNTLFSLKAAINSPSFTGAPTAPTAPAGANTTQLATTAYVRGELTSSVTGLAPVANPVFTGLPAAPTAAVGTSTSQLATTSFVQGEVASFNAKAACVASATALAVNTTLTAATYCGQLTPVDTGAGAVSITLPTTGNVLNDTYGFYDPKGTWATNNATFVVDFIHGQAGPFVGDVNNASITLKYINSTIGWIRI